MVKFLMVFMTMVFITASAFLMASDEKSFDVILPEKKIPYEEDSLKETHSSQSEAFKEPPRFIPDEPLQSDPSAEENTKEGEGKETKPKVPDEKETKKAAGPYVMEIINIKENAFANLASMEKKIAIDYLSLPKEERDSAPLKLQEKYMPRISLILETADRDVDRSLKKMESALKAINAKTDIVEEAKKSYLDEKEEKLNSYRELLKSLGQDIDFSEILDN